MSEKTLLLLEKTYEAYPAVLGIKELQKMLGVGRRQAIQYLQEKKIPSFTAGKSYRIPKACVITFLAEL